LFFTAQNAGVFLPANIYLSQVSLRVAVFFNEPLAGYFSFTQRYDNRAQQAKVRFRFHAFILQKKCQPRRRERFGWQVSQKRLGSFTPSS